jgi:hypothetical protein
VIGRCHFPSLTTLRVEIVSGRPTLLELDRAPADPMLRACVETALSSVRWDCLEDPACALFEWDTLPIP